MKPEKKGKPKAKKLMAVVLVIVLVLGCCAGFGALKVWRTAQRLYVGLVEHIQEESEDISRTIAADWGGMVGEQRHYTLDHAWTESSGGLIAHAMGGIDGSDYTNSPEAFQANYALGHRVFEVDFDVSEEYYLIASHDVWRWRERTGAEGDYTAENFLASKVDGKYTTMDYRDVIDLMAEHPDIYIVTDTKYYDKTTVTLQFTQLVRYAQQTAPEVLDRLVPQIYKTEMLDWVMDVYPFRSVIYTLYDTTWTPRSVVDFCRQRGVDFVTVPAEELTEDIAGLWHESGLTIGVHTVNDEAQADALRKLGADVVYTDFLAPAP